MYHVNEMERLDVALQTFADWVDGHPTNGEDFTDWHSEYWPQYKERCNDVCRNIYMMQESVNAFERCLCLDSTWETVFQNQRLKKALREICLSVEVSPEEFFSVAQKSYEKKCRVVFDRYFS